MTQKGPGKRPKTDANVQQKKRDGDQPVKDQKASTKLIRKPAYPRLWQVAKHKSLGGSPKNSKSAMIPKNLPQ